MVTPTQTKTTAQERRAATLAAGDLAGLARIRAEEERARDEQHLAKIAVCRQAVADAQADLAALRARVEEAKAAAAELRPRWEAARREWEAVDLPFQQAYAVADGLNGAIQHAADRVAGEQRALNALIKKLSEEGD